MDTNRTVTLQPVSMVLPTKRCVYSPSAIEDRIQISYTDFLHRLTDAGQAMWFNPDPSPTYDTINSGAKRVTAYLDVLDWRAGWFVVVGEP